MTSALPTPFLADADIGQVVFVILFLVVGFIQWVIKTLKAKAESPGHTPPSMPVPTLPTRARSPQSTPSFGGALGDLMGDFRKVMEPREAPPPLPQPARRVVRVPVPASAPAAPAPLWVPQAVQPASDSASLRPAGKDRKRSNPHAALLRSPHGYRQAFILREVLSAPRALREYAGPED